MKWSMKSAFIIIALFQLVLFQANGQKEESIDSASIQLIKAAREIMTSAGSCALITIDHEGCPRVREMDPFPPEDDFTVWFGTNPRSRKVEQIKNNPKVTLYYLEAHGAGYVTIHGTAQLVDDPEEKDRRWKDDWKAFYPNKTNDYLLIKVTPVWMETISYPHGIIGDPVTWEPPGITFNSKY